MNKQFNINFKNASELASEKGVSINSMFLGEKTNSTSAFTKPLGQHSHVMPSSASYAHTNQKHYLNRGTSGKDGDSPKFTNAELNAFLSENAKNVRLPQDGNQNPLNIQEMPI